MNTKHIITVTISTPPNFNVTWTTHEFGTAEEALTFQKEQNEKTWVVANYSSPENQQAEKEKIAAAKADLEARKAKLIASGWVFSSTKTGRPKAAHPVIHPEPIICREGFYELQGPAFLSTIEALS